MDDLLCRGQLGHSRLMYLLVLRVLVLKLLDGGQQLCVRPGKRILLERALVELSKKPLAMQVLLQVPSLLAAVLIVLFEDGVGLADLMERRRFPQAAVGGGSGGCSNRKGWRKVLIVLGEGASYVDEVACRLCRSLKGGCRATGARARL